jgi:hypothetical protein
MFRPVSRYPILVAITFVISPVSAAAGQQAAPEVTRPIIRAVRLNTDERISVDGRLDEAVWQRAEPITRFTQSDPRNGEPSTEAASIRVLFDGDRLYIGAQLDDSNPEGILGKQMVRDGALDADDRFMWVLDPYNDQRSGYFFETNPAGVMSDAQLVAASNANVGTALNRAWDGIWLARVRRHDLGWTVEVEIPFRTLNFNPQADVWGANFQRTVRRKNEDSYWNGWGRNQGLLDLTSAGQLVGISDVGQGYGLDIRPYVIGSYRDVSTGSAAATYKGDAGLDFFYSVTPQVKANLTINTDFAQTEVDDRQVNLTRFPLFFPEKRGFFLDGADNFDFTREPSDAISGFFSRRIGLDSNGQPQAIDYGAKMSGQMGRFNFGFLQVRTGEERGILGEDFTVFRQKRQLLAQSYVGVMYTRRATRGGLIPNRHSIGADFQLATSRFRGSDNLQVNGFFMRTPDGINHGDDAAWGFRVSYPNDHLNVRWSFREHQKNFNPAIGFVERGEHRKWSPVVRFAPRPRNHPWIRQVAAQFFFEMYTDTKNNLVERYYQLTPIDLTMHSGESVSFTFTPSTQHLPEDFRIARDIVLPAGTDYDYTRYAFRFATASRRVVSGSANVTVGSFYSGTRREIAATLNLRPRRGILATFANSYNEIELAEGRFTTNLLRAIVNTQLNPFVSIANNVQFDSVSRVLGWQSRFRWNLKPGNDIYVVWLNNWLDSSTGLMTLDRNAAMKAIYNYGF